MSPSSSSPPPRFGAGQNPCLDAKTLEDALATLQTRLDQLQESLTQQNKLATLGMITAVIAHEFNNILTPMISYTRFALTDGADEALRTKALTKALAGGERLANISKSLLGFTRGDESSSANVAEALRETLACLSRDLSKDGITLTMAVPADLWVAMNAGQFQQVLMNLIVNARSAMLSTTAGALGSRPGVSLDQRSRTAIEATRRGPAPKRLSIEARVSPESGKAEIAIADTGPGIPADVLPRIFEPFFTTKRVMESTVQAGVGTSVPGEQPLPRGGTGLGLTICQELVAAAGGMIEAASEEGKGARFVIHLRASGPPVKS